MGCYVLIAFLLDLFELVILGAVARYSFDLKLR